MLAKPLECVRFFGRDGREQREEKGLPSEAAGLSKPEVGQLDYSDVITPSCFFLSFLSSKVSGRPSFHPGPNIGDADAFMVS